MAVSEWKKKRRPSRVSRKEGVLEAKMKKIKLPEWTRDMPEKLLEELWGVVRASKKFFHAH